MIRYTRAAPKNASLPNSLTSVLERFKRSKDATSPAISTVLLTGAVVAMLVATIPFAKDFLDARTAEYEFNGMKESMQTAALQLEDVAWTIGRIQTTHYTSNFGLVGFQTSALNYTVYVDKGQGYSCLANYSTGVIMFNMGTRRFSLGNNYYESLHPSDRSFLLDGVSAPISHVYVVEKLPMSDGSFIRVVIAPSIRMINSTISTDVQRDYQKFYLPILVPGSSSDSSQSIKLEGNMISLKLEEAVNKLKVQISFPKSSLGLDQAFYNFDSIEKEVDVPDGSTVEFYTMNIAVSLGVD